MVHETLMRRAFVLHFSLVIGFVAGCTTFPELEDTQTEALEAAEFPVLVPVDPILAGTKPVDTTAPDTRTDFDARLAGLRARAEAMRGTVLTDAERRKLEDGIR